MRVVGASSVSSSSSSSTVSSTDSLVVVVVEDERVLVLVELLGVGLRVEVGDLLLLDLLRRLVGRRLVVVVGCHLRSFAPISSATHLTGGFAAGA